MAGHEKASQKGTEKEEQKHRQVKQNPDSSVDFFHSWDEGFISIGETPFQPQVEKHTTLLTMARLHNQRASVIMQLQQNYGNRYVQRLIESMRVQAKMTVNRPDDVYEQEANRVADTVINYAAPHVRRREEEEEEPVQTQPVLQRQEEEEEAVQVKSSDRKVPRVSEDLESKINMARGHGHPLSDSVRTSLEPRFSYDFSDITLHTDAEANDLSRQLGAEAFTIGSDIFFKDGAYQPGTDGGKGLIAHELTHVVQQTQGSLPLSGGKVSKKESGVVVSNYPVGRTGDKVQRSDLVIQRAGLSSPRFTGNKTLVDISNGTGTLKRGDRGSAVSKVQHAIADSGILYRRYGVDGIFGKETEKTVKLFQKNNGVSGDPSGEVGPNTLEKLDKLFPAMALPATAGDTYKNLSGILAILSQWNAAMIRDLRNLKVHMVADLQWDDETWSGTSWSKTPMDGAGETSGIDIYIATDATNEEVASTLYHEYQHARSPYSYRKKSWAEEEERVYTLQTQWEIDRGMTTDPSLTTTDPTTGKKEVSPTGVTAQVETYPGLAAAQPGEVISKIGKNKVRVQLPNGRRIVRKAVKGDSVPGPRKLTPPIHHVKSSEWKVTP